MELPPHVWILFSLGECESGVRRFQVKPPNVVQVVRNFLPQRRLFRIALSDLPRLGIEVAASNKEAREALPRALEIRIRYDPDINTDPGPHSAGCRIARARKYDRPADPIPRDPSRWTDTNDELVVGFVPPAQQNVGCPLGSIIGDLRGDLFPHAHRNLDFSRGK